MSSLRRVLLPSCVVLAIASFAPADGPQVSGKSPNAPPSDDPTQSPVNPTYANARFVHYDDGTIGMWGVESVLSDSGELIVIRFEPQARPGDNPQGPDFVLDPSDWANVRITTESDAAASIIGIACLSTSLDGELTALAFHNSLGMNDSEPDPRLPGEPDGGPRVRGCDLRSSVSKSGLALKCKRRPSICPNPPFRCFLILTIQPDGTVTAKCDCREA